MEAPGMARGFFVPVVLSSRVRGEYAFRLPQPKGKAPELAIRGLSVSVGRVG